MYNFEKLSCTSIFLNKHTFILFILYYLYKTYIMTESLIRGSVCFRKIIFRVNLIILNQKILTRKFIYIMLHILIHIHVYTYTHISDCS